MDKTKKLYQVANECVCEMKAIGLRPNYISEYKVNSRAKSRWGMCTRNNKNGQYTIEIASSLLEDNAPIQGLKETIIHELIHSCDFCMNHGNLWTSYANRMNRAYGYNIKRVNSYTDKGFEENPMVKDTTPKYKISCKACNRSWNYQRESKIVKACRANNARCACGKSDFSVVTLR